MSIRNLSLKITSIGFFKDINSRNKRVRVFATPGSDQCVVRVLDAYISKLPDSPDAFYLRPLSLVPSFRTMVCSS